MSGCVRRAKRSHCSETRTLGTDAHTVRGELAVGDASPADLIRGQNVVGSGRKLVKRFWSGSTLRGSRGGHDHEPTDDHVRPASAALTPRLGAAKQSLANSHLVRDEKRRPISSARVRQETIGLFVADDLLRVGIEAQRPAQTV